MASELDLKALEKQVYMSFHEDGIIDIFIGLLLFVDGLLMLSGNGAFVGVAVVIVFLSLPVKRMVTVPRIGLVNFSRARKIKLNRAALILLFLGVLVFLLFVLRNSFVLGTQWMRDHFDLVFGALFALLAGAGVVLTAQKRYIVYIPGILILFTAGSLFTWPFPVTLSLTGAMVSVSGMIAVLRFLKKYPRPELEEGQH